LLDHGSNVSFIADESSSFESFFGDIAAANARDNGSISVWFDWIESGSKIVVEDVDVGVVVVVCGLFV